MCTRSKTRALCLMMQAFVSYDTLLRPRRICNKLVGMDKTTKQKMTITNTVPTAKTVSLITNKQTTSTARTNNASSCS